jgi:hypothetical protein
MKKIRLHRGAIPKEAVTVIASETLKACGVDPAKAPPGHETGDEMPDGTI